MRRQIVAAVCSVAFGAMATSSLSVAQQDTASACLEQWRAGDLFVTRCPAGDALSHRAAASTTPKRDRQVRSTIKDLMEAIVDPSADVLWAAVKTVVDENGVHETLPTTPEEWLNLRLAAIRIVEGANLLMVPGRRAAPVGAVSEVPGVELEPAQIDALIRKQRKKFGAFAMALRDLGFETLQAIDAKDTASLLDLGGRMQNLCEGCHKAFWYPNERVPP